MIEVLDGLEGECGLGVMLDLQLGLHSANDRGILIIAAGGGFYSERWCGTSRFREGPKSLFVSRRGTC